MAESVDAPSRRIVELEVRYTEQQDVIEQLSDAIYEQQRTLEALRARLAAVEKRGTEGSGADSPADPEADRPPHY